MNPLGILTWLAVALVIGCLAVGGFILGRIYILSRQRGSFRTFMRTVDHQNPEKTTDWMRGYACYGRTNLAWSGLVRLRTRPDLLLPRTTLELVRAPKHEPETGTTTLYLSDGPKQYEVVLSTGDYQGVVSWVDSAPPEEH